MGGSRPILRISFGLVLLTSTILLGLHSVGWIPNFESTDTRQRVQLAETVAAQAATGVEGFDLRSVHALLRITVKQNEELRSAGVRSPMGRLLVSVAHHRELWEPPAEGRSTSTQMLVPLFRGGGEWATIELLFQEPDANLLTSLANDPLLRTLLAVGGLGFILYGLYMRHTLRYLDPSAVIPTRVQATLDIMTEGVAVIDPHDDIVMTNVAFAARFGKQPTDLMGHKASSLGWRDREGEAVASELPWIAAMREGTPFLGETLTLYRSARERVVLTVNGAPVLDGWGRPTGAMVTFDDVTELEQGRAELQRAHDELEKSQDEIRLQNEELQQLARQDPLTGAANRRSFMEEGEQLFRRAREEGTELAFLMLDIDHFKLVNDTHGHRVGDDVIRRVADGLMTQVGGRGPVCRYGGEEFCVGLEEVGPEDAEALGELVRRQVETPGFASVPVTVSLGVASIRDGAEDLSSLIDQADRALYASKKDGRNRVTRFDQMDSRAQNTA